MSCLSLLNKAVDMKYLGLMLLKQNEITLYRQTRVSCVGTSNVPNLKSFSTNR